MGDSSRPENDKFQIGLMADDLLDLTITMCDRRETYSHRVARKQAERFGINEKVYTPKFPNFLYETYVNEMIQDALNIQEDVYIANEGYLRNDPERKVLARHAMAKCVRLNHLTRLAADKGWISEKERDRWQSLITNLRFKIYNWLKAL